MERLCPKFNEQMERLHGENGKRRCAWVEFIAAQSFNACVTLQTNKDKMEFNRLRTLVGQWLKRTDGAFIGRQHRKHPELRITGWFHCEKLKSKPHAHGYFRLPQHFVESEGAIAIAKMKMEVAWGKVIASGDTKLELQASPFGTSRYQTKEFKRQDFWETIIDAQEYWPCIKRQPALQGANKTTRQN